MNNWQKMLVSGLDWIMPSSRILAPIILFVLVILTCIIVNHWNDGSKLVIPATFVLGSALIISFINIGLLVALGNVNSKISNTFNSNEIGVNYTDQVIEQGFGTNGDNLADYLRLNENTNSDQLTIAKLQYYPNQNKIVFEPLNKTGKAYVCVVRYLDKLKQHEHLANIKIDASLSSTRADFETINGKQSVICYANNKGVNSDSIKVLRY